jgi:fatty-acyl-CoA synthase
MALGQVKGMNVAQIIEFYGNDPRSRGRAFLMYRDDEGVMQAVSFAEYYHHCLRYGAMIRQIRAEKGKDEADRFHVGFFMQNTPEVAYLFGGCAFTNATLVGINNAQVGERLSADLKKTDIDAVFVDDAAQPKTGRTFVETLIEAHECYGLGELYPRYVIARRKQAKHHPPEVTVLEERLARSEPERFSPAPLEVDGTGVIIFTSGTTGMPKGIEVTWKKLIAVAMGFTSLLNYTENDVAYICMPLNHSNSLYINFMTALLNGARIFLRRRFSASNFIKDITEARVTVWNCVGDPVTYILGNVGSDADYSSLPLRTVVSTGTNAANRAKFTRIFGLEIFAEAYGSTEVGAVALVTPDTPDYSVGQVISGRDVKVVDEFTGQRCEPARVDSGGKITNFERAVGEILVSQASLGDSAFSGYYNLPAESAERVDEDGYYHMGDLGCLEEKGGGRYVIFLGRTGADRLRTKGENFSATFVEEIINRHPGVRNCAVIGIPFVDSTENDNPVYVLEVEDPKGFDLDEFHRYCQTEIPFYALPGFIRLMAELPRTDTHKVKKSALMSEFIERTPEKDGDERDVIYMVGPDGIEVFRTGDFQREMARCHDPAVRARFLAATRRHDLF